MNLIDQKIYYSFLFIILIISSACQDDTVFPEENWIYRSPSSQNVDSLKMLEVLNNVSQYFGPDQLEETIIIRNGFIIFKGDSTTKSHNIYSCTKSFTSTVLGLLIDDGYCSLDNLCYEIEPILKDQYSNVTLKHFTTMTSGYNAVGASRWCDGCSEDWSLTPFSPAKPLFEPGEKFCYWDEAQMFFGRVLTVIAQEDLKDYLDRKIMTKIGLGDWEWWYEENINEIPVRNGCTGIKLNAQQLARFGYLFLCNGNWRGEQLINPNWISEATKVQVNESIPVAETDRKSTNGSGRYGFNWWLKGNVGDMDYLPDGSYFMSGLNNNVCFIIPEWNMVFVRMGDDYNPPEGKRFVYNLLFRELAKAIIE